jgi:SAM-dependent methyltransferase
VTPRTSAYGERALSPVDRFGVWLSLRALRRDVDWSARPRVLDLGCGYEAHLLRTLNPRIGAATAVDVALAPAVAASGVRAIEAPIEQALPGLEDGSADVVLAISVLEHLDDDLGALRECRRVLAPGGVLAVNVPTWLGKPVLEVSAFRLGLSPAEEMDDHKRYYGRRDLWPLLVRAGFRPSAIRLRYHKGGLNLFGTAVVGSEG